MPPQSPGGSIFVSLSTSGGEHWTAPDSRIRTTQYDPSSPPNVTNATPAYSDLLGGDVVVLSGINFAPYGASRELMQCVFGSQVVEASFVRHDTIRCAVPASLFGRAHSVSLGARFGQSGATGATVPFTYYHAARPPQVDSLTPSFADLHLRPVLTITGSNFAPTGHGKLLCSFGSLGQTDAAFVSTGTVLCRSPPDAHPEEDWDQATVKVATDGVSFSLSGAKFTYFRSPQERRCSIR